MRQKNATEVTFDFRILLAKNKIEQRLLELIGLHELLNLLFVFVRFAFCASRTNHDVFGRMGKIDKLQHINGVATIFQN